VNADSGVFIRKPQLQCRDYLVAGPYKDLKQYKPQEWNQMVVEVKDGVAHCTCNGEVLEAALADACHRTHRSRRRSWRDGIPTYSAQGTALSSPMESKMPPSE
jgi:hypothetical protein